MLSGARLRRCNGLACSGLYWCSNKPTRLRVRIAAQACLAAMRGIVSELFHFGDSDRQRKPTKNPFVAKAGKKTSKGEKASKGGKAAKKGDSRKAAAKGKAAPRTRAPAKKTKAAKPTEKTAKQKKSSSSSASQPKPKRAARTQAASGRKRKLTDKEAKKLPHVSSILQAQMEAQVGSFLNRPFDKNWKPASAFAAEHRYEGDGWAKELVKLTQENWPMGNFTLNFWSDCAGTGSEVFAGKILAEQLKKQRNVDLTVNLTGCCDKNLDALYFCAVNHNPRILVRDMMERKIVDEDGRQKVMVFDLRTSEWVSMPEGLDVYGLGFPCTPWSRQLQTL